MQINSVQNYTYFQGLGSKYSVQDRREENRNYAPRYYESPVQQKPEPEIKTPPKEWYANLYNTSVNLPIKMGEDKISTQAQDILEVLSDQEVQESKGKSLDDEFVVNTIVYLINSANPKEKSEIIDKMAELRKINYNKVDENEISILEHILNAEDSDLLNLADNAYARLEYYSPLDYAYKNIQNPEFKEEVDKLTLNFNNLKDAAQKEDIEAVAKNISDFDSPFFTAFQRHELKRILKNAKDEKFIRDFEILMPYKYTDEPFSIY